MHVLGNNCEVGAGCVRIFVICPAMAFMSQKDKKYRGDLVKSLSILSQMGVMIVACVLVGVLLGRFLDGLFGTAPWLLIFCSITGVAAAFKSIFDFSKRL